MQILFLYAFYVNMKQCFPDTCLVYSQSILFIYSYFDLYHIRISYACIIFNLAKYADING